MKDVFNSKKQPLTFRRWDSKGYSVFSSLRKVVRIGCLLAIYLRFANHDVLAAQIDTTSVVQSYDLESIDVSSDLPPETYSNMSRVVVMVSKKEIERAAISSINELLEYASNIDIRQRGINGVQADVSIRGSSFDQVLILLNGVNVTDPQTGHHNLNLPIDFSVVERVEILKGPGSWKFGPGAFGGAINFITTSSKNPFLKVELEGGEYLLNSEKISANFAVKNSTHLLSVNHSSSSGYIDNTDFEITNFFYSGKISNQKSEGSLQIGYTDKGFGANSFYSPKYLNQYEETQTFLTSLSFKTNVDKLQLEPKVYYRRHNDRFLLFRDNPDLYSNYHTNDVFGTNMYANYIHSSKSVTTFGVDLRSETIWSNNLGEVVANPVKSPINDTIFLNHFHSRTNFSSFIGHKRYFSKLMVNVGLNLTRNSDMSFKWFIYPGLDMNYRFNKKSSVFASANKTMRMPTFTELYYSSPSNEGNSNLLPEEAIGYEAGYQFNIEGLNCSVAGFYSQGKNMIDWVKETLEEKWKTLNYTRLNTSGVEFSATADFRKLMPDQKIVNTVKINYTFINQEKPESNYISNYSLNYLKHRFDFDLNHSIIKNIYGNWHVNYSDRNGQYEKIVDKVSLGMTNYEPFITCDLKISWIYSGWNVYGSVNNIFDKEYFDIGNIVQPGRWVKIGVSKAFNLN
jgi:vitamin B12 transporter